MTKALNIFGLTLAVLYLFAALLTGPKYGVTSRDKDEAIARIERTANGKDASLVARPFLSLMMNVITSAKTSLLLSCGVVFVNGVIFFANIRTNRQQQPRETPPGVPHKR